MEHGGTRVSPDVDGIEYCCKQMRENFGNPIRFTTDPDDVTVLLESPATGIGSVDGEIQYRPFCAEEIETEFEGTFETEMVRVDD